MNGWGRLLVPGFLRANGWTLLRAAGLHPSQLLHPSGPSVPRG